MACGVQCQYSASTVPEQGSTTVTRPVQLSVRNQGESSNIGGGKVEVRWRYDGTTQLEKLFNHQNKNKNYKSKT